MPKIFWPRPLAHALCATPLALLLLRVWQQDFGPDPIAYLTHYTGSWALRLLLVCLAITPLRRLSGWNALVRLRRLIGLWAFFYACIHLGIYLLDMRGYWAQIVEDVLKRPYVTVGFLAWLLMVPLALTSTQGMIRRLGRRWQSLHRGVYVVGVCGCLHFLWLIKSGKQVARIEPLVYLAILGVLLLARLPWRAWLGRSQRSVASPQPTD